MTDRKKYHCPYTRAMLILPLWLAAFYCSGHKEAMIKSAFTTVKIHQGVLVFWPDHCQRLKHCADFLNCNDNLEKIVIDAIAQSEYLPLVKYGKLRLCLKKVSAEEFSCDITFEKWSEAWWDAPQEPPRVLKVIDYLDPKFYPSEVKMDDYQQTREILSQLQAEGIRDFIAVSKAGEVQEASLSNVFLLLDGKIVTPKLRAGLLSGVTRKHFINFCESQGFVVEERVVLKAELFLAQAIMQTSSIQGVQAVDRCEDKLYQNELIKPIITGFKKYRQEWINEHRQFSLTGKMPHLREEVRI